MLKLTGAFQKNPDRARERENEPGPTGPLGPPPDFLDETHAARWRELAEWCPWLEAADRVLVEATCRLWVRIRNNEAKPGEWGILTQNLSKLGMTPTDRSRVKAPPKRDEQNPYAELA